ncbi:hypothetical protein BDV30DRAFT_5681 [Aspergillus minisclerotigenes]|uniref:Amino acid permease/ SLC12A domain-containing protein n=1 Tax=Aspergillus minisclerotigenes TaxID=656917 RepID=A0A5N6JM32_9EURO|nr:hypothetical protein BDV30DRAFT_5681 [Aspergillus minisclerotigenes]
MLTCLFWFWVFFCLLIQFMTTRCDIVGGSFLYSRVKHIYVCLLDHTSCPAIFVTTLVLAYGIRIVLISQQLLVLSPVSYPNSKRQPQC